MFRKMRRLKQEAPPEDCRRILREEKRAVLSVIGDDGFPYGVPVNFYYEESEDTVYIHGAREGHKIDALRRCGKVCLTLWDEGFREEGDWAWHLTSVIAMGEAELIDDLNVVTDEVRKLGLKYNPCAEEVEREIQSAIHRVQLIAVHIRHLTGKRVYEK